MLGFAAQSVWAAPQLEWRAGDGQGELRLCGLPAAALAPLAADQLAEILWVRVVDAEAAQEADLAALPPPWGSFDRQQDCLFFRPRHQPAPGMVLRARFDAAAFDRLTGSAGSEPAELRVAMAPSAPTTRVEAIYPTAAELPENALRLYVHFSGPMSLKGIEKNVHLRDATGAEIPTAFVEVKDGLWDPGHRRLTLILHPGRVKSGIGIGEVLGKVLAEGATLKLEIDPAARDSAGAPLYAGGERSWRIGPPQRQPLDPAGFRLEVGPEPAAPLRVEAPVALDHALAASAFTVLHQGREIAGRWQIQPGEKRLEFLPDEPWQRGEPYQLRISAVLEDVAGNRLGRAFEVDARTSAAAAPVTLSFQP